jgi:hypothetical protein
MAGLDAHTAMSTQSEAIQTAMLNILLIFGKLYEDLRAGA